MQLQSLGFFAWLLLALSAVGCVYLWYASHAVRRFAAPVPSRAASGLPATILKPLRGEDSALADNLRSFCRQDYPAFQIVYGVADNDDPAVPVVRDVIAEFPDVAMTLVVDPRSDGVNLKIANLRNMLPAALHPVLVLADSDMRVMPNYLAAVMAPLDDPAVGLVTCLYRGRSTGGLWSDLASLHINHGFLPQAVVAEALGMGAGCFGATMALRRTILDRVGGLAALADVLADDHVLGQLVRQQGLRVELSHVIVDDIVAEPDFGHMFRHELRWGRTVRLVAPAGFAGSVVTYPVPLALLAAILGVLPVAAPAMLAVALACRWWTGRRIDEALGLRPSPAWQLPLRDVLSFAVFIASFCGRSVAWRDRTFRIGRHGQLTPDNDRPA